MIRLHLTMLIDARIELMLLSRGVIITDNREAKFMAISDCIVKCLLQKNKKAAISEMYRDGFGLIGWRNNTMTKATLEIIKGLADAKNLDTYIADGVNRILAGAKLVGLEF